jgi:predicted tellurium resistance membrane protein TerC
MDFHVSDLLTIALLVLLEGLLSADNALVLAILVLGLPRKEQRQALRYGIAGAFVFRILATLLAIHLLQLTWIKLIGAGYLLYLSWHHFFAHGGSEERRTIKPARAWMGLSAFWATVVKVELTDIVLVRRYPALVDGAFIIIAWVGIKLLVEYLHSIGVVHFEVSKWLSFGLIIVIFVISYLYARRQGPVEEVEDDEAQQLFADSDDGTLGSSDDRKLG